MTDAVCLYWAPVIALAVSLSKRLPWIGRHPKTLAACIAVALAGYRALHPGAVMPAVAELVACAAAQFAGAVATFETVVKPISKRVGLPKNRRGEFV